MPVTNTNFKPRMQLLISAKKICIIHIPIKQFHGAFNVEINLIPRTSYEEISPQF
jgi:hypothetical protein